MEGFYMWALRLLLVSVVATHLATGVLALISPSERIAKPALMLFYGATVDLTPQARHLIRMLGAYMVAVAFMSTFAVADPVGNRGIVYGIAVLLALRAGQRIVNAKEIREAFAVFPVRMKLQTALFAVLAAALLALRLAIGAGEA